MRGGRCDEGRRAIRVIGQVGGIGLVVIVGGVRVEGTSSMHGTESTGIRHVLIRVTEVQRY